MSPLALCFVNVFSVPTPILYFISIIFSKQERITYTSRCKCIYYVGILGVIGSKCFSVGVKCFLLESNEKNITEDEETRERPLLLLCDIAELLKTFT